MQSEGSRVRYTTVAESRAAGVTYHLIPDEVWSRHRDSVEYLPEAFDQDGFIHCTNGLQELVAVGNRYYTADPRPYRALVLKVGKISSPVRYDDPEEKFPHIYGPLNTNAVVGILNAKRDESGSFLSFSRE
jgi:uncharacterized protein (DUF952 family)